MVLRARSMITHLQTIKLYNCVKKHNRTWWHSINS